MAAYYRRIQLKSIKQRFQDQEPRVVCALMEPGHIKIMARYKIYLYRILYEYIRI